MGKKTIPLALCVILLAVLACGSQQRERSTATPGGDFAPNPTLATGISSVPDEYRDIYEDLSANLDQVETFLAGRGESRPGSTTFGAELIIANGNRGAALLQPETMTAVQQFLDQLKLIGVGGVTLQIPDPLLKPDFPQSEEYLDFFREVVEQVRARDMKLLIESGPAFADPQYSRVRFDWSNLTLDQFFQMRGDQLRLIAAELQPDYLSLGNEPGTQMMLTGLSFTILEFLNFIRDVATSIDRSSGILLGAGTGSWEDPAYLERLMEEPSLDFLNLHIYPLSSSRSDYFERAAEIAAAARDRGMMVIIGEAWLYKASSQEIDYLLSYQDVYARDVYSFWQPLDIRFVEAIVELAQLEQLEYVSFFWAGFFFGYLEYDETTRDLPFVERYLRLNQAQYANIVAGALTETGRAYQSLLDSIGEP
jgi:hypothetical protein